MKLFVLSAVMIFFLITVVTILFVIGLQHRKGFGSKAMNTQLKKLAETLKLPMQGGTPYFQKLPFLYFIKKPVEIEGSYQNKAASIYHQPAYKNSTYATIRIFGSNPYKLKITLMRISLWKKLLRKFRLSSTPLGYDDFDRLFVISTNNIKATKAIFSHTLKNQFIQTYNIYGFKGILRLKRELFTYTELGRIRNEKTRKRYEAIFHLMVCFRDQIDLYSK